MILIPKLLHFIWLGNHPMHPLMSKWIAKWSDLNPSWLICMWADLTGLSRLRANVLDAPLARDAVQKFHTQQGQCESFASESRYSDLLAKSCHLSQRSNIWRYEIVQTFGGLYVDTDVEPIRPIDPLIDGKSAFAGTYISEPGHHACSFFGAAPRHSWTRELVDRLPEQDPTLSLSMGSAYFSKITNAHPDVCILPGMSVLNNHNPWWQPAGVVPDVDDSGLRPPASRRIVNPETFAIHHWSSKWFSKGFERLDADPRVVGEKS